MADGAGDGEQQRGSLLEAAYAQLAALGPVGDGRSASLSAVAKALGMSRSQLYRRWPTAADLAADLAVHRSTPVGGWHATVCTDDGGPLEEALRRTLASKAAADGVMTRASVARWPGSRARDRLAAWEAVHLSDLADRIEREWGAERSGPWTDVALTLAALLDGMPLIWAQAAEHPGDPMPPELAEEVVQTALRMVAFLLHDAEGDDRPIRVEGSGPDQRQDEVIPLPERMVVALADGTLDLTDGERRVVDMGVLARSRGVSERSLYARWPAPADLNADVYLESVRRVQAAFAQIVLEVFLSNASGPFANTMPLFARMNAWFMDPDRFPEGSVHLGLADVLDSPAVLDRVRAPVELGLKQADMQIAGLLQASGFRLRSDVRMRTYTMLILGMGMGAHRLAATHPQLRHRRLRYLGEEFLASGVGHTAMTRTCTELVDDPVGGGPDAEPPMPPSLRPLPD